MRMDGNVTNKLIWILSVCSLAALLAHGEPAEAQAALQRRLAAATRVECHFTALATGTWDGGTPSAKVTETDLDTAFFDINVDEGTAEAESPFGASLIIVRYAEGYLHLMQMAYAGPLHVTTILARETKNGRLMAVHTRHEYTPTSLPGYTSRPEMYIGDCAITE
jgi:hypothetical protein